MIQKIDPANIDKGNVMLTNSASLSFLMNGISLEDTSLVPIKSFRNAMKKYKVSKAFKEKIVIRYFNAKLLQQKSYPTMFQWVKYIHLPDRNKFIDSRFLSNLKPIKLISYHIDDT